MTSSSRGIRAKQVRYAAYGSNLHPARLGERLSSATFLGTGFVSGWSLRFNKRGQDTSAKCSIVRGAGGIHVAVFDISPADKIILDAIEGVGCGYAHASLSVSGFGQCMTYVAESGYVDESLAPFDWYKELVHLGATAHGFPSDYLEQIASVKAQQDLDVLRATQSWQIVERVRAAALT